MRHREEDTAMPSLRGKSHGRTVRRTWVWLVVVAALAGSTLVATDAHAAVVVNTNAGFGPDYTVSYSANSEGVTTVTVITMNPEFSQEPILDTEKKVIGFKIKNGNGKVVKEVYVPGKEPGKR